MWDTVGTELQPGCGNPNSSEESLFTPDSHIQLKVFHTRCDAHLTSALHPEDEFPGLKMLTV